MKCTAANLRDCAGFDSKAWFWLVSTREAYAEDKEAKEVCGKTKETTEDKRKDLLIIFIIHLTNITESKPVFFISQVSIFVNQISA